MQEKPERPPTLAVVLKGYPRLSETFIAQELKALEDRGFAFEIWSLRAPYDDRTHPIHDEIRARPRYLPEYLHGEPLRVLRGLLRAARLRGFWRAGAAFLHDLARDRTVNRIRRFGQAAVLATELPAETRFLYVHFLHTPASTARYAALMRDMEWGFSAHAKDIWTIPDWEKREKIADARFGVTCTASGAAHLRGLAPEAGRVALAYHGLDLSRFPSPPVRGPRQAPLRILSVGRLVEKKGYDVLLDALCRLPAELDWRFEHIGGGKLAAALDEAAAAHGLAGRIDWRGKQDQRAVIEAMRAADLFVLPSRIADDGDRDGLPNVLMEAASQRLPIVSTAVSAIPEFIRDGEEGTLVPPGDAAALAAAIARLAGDEAQAERFGTAAYRRLLAEFGMGAGIETIASRLSAALTASEATVAPLSKPAAAEGGSEAMAGERA
ncbi:MAG: glycosyltransferase family 4 protein [Pseudomonadota bacterium]